MTFKMPEPFWHAVVSERSPVINKAIRREDVAYEYAQKCEEHGYRDPEVIALVPLDQVRAAYEQGRGELLTDEHRTDLLAAALYISARDDETSVLNVDHAERIVELLCNLCGFDIDAALKDTTK